MSNSSPIPFFDVRMRGFPTRTEVADAVDLIRKRVSALGSETIGLDAAAGRVLAAAVTATVPVPHFDRAAFDGYALRAEETFGAGPYNPLTLRIVGEAMPGRPFARLHWFGRSCPHHDRLAGPVRGRRDLAGRIGRGVGRFVEGGRAGRAGKEHWPNRGGCARRPNGVGGWPGASSPGPWIALIHRNGSGAGDTPSTSGDPHHRRRDLAAGLEARGLPDRG